MQRVHSFAPVCGEAPRVLILGSMPGVASLQAQQYYAHPRNAFWPIMQALFGIATDWPYARRVKGLEAHGVALWDVLESCVRTGSLDAAIAKSSMRPNDLSGLLRQRPTISSIFFNGQMAETAFTRHVLPRADPAVRALLRRRLPSTSPANASWSFERKLAAWRVLVDGR